MPGIPDDTLEYAQQQLRICQEDLAQGEYAYVLARATTALLALAVRDAENPDVNIHVTSVEDESALRQSPRVVADALHSVQSPYMTASKAVMDWIDETPGVVLTGCTPAMLVSVAFGSVGIKP